MKILLICAGGVSTSILMKKMETYWKENGEELEISAVGVVEYQEVAQNFDIILVGPQVSYRVKEIQENTGLPVAAIPSFDYAVANGANIMKLAKKLYAEK
ncbi:MAG: PTS sugar transporter subunit IIB [Anaerorhabdus sp.]